MNEGFIKNEELLEETHQIKDKLDFSIIQNDFKKKIDNLKNSCLVGLVGGFGSGKSTMLYNLSKNKVDNEVWINFDAWKYPERNNLWEGFVLDFVKEVNNDFFKKIRKEIDGEKFDNTKNLIKTLSSFLPGGKILENFNHLFKTSPVKRVFEFQEILENFINKKIEFNTIFIIIEDIDRSGDKGIYFLETLNQFIKKSNLNKKIICIIPISNKNFKESNASYLKSIDYIESFQPKNLDFSIFIKDLFNETIFKNNEYVEDLNYLFKSLFLNEIELTIRKIKSILRRINADYKLFSEEDKNFFDVRLVVAFYFAKYLDKKRITSNIEANSMGVRCRLTRDIIWLKEFIKRIATNSNQNSNNYIIEFVNNPKLSVPNFHKNDYANPSEYRYYLSDKYLTIIQ